MIDPDTAAVSQDLARDKDLLPTDLHRLLISQEPEDTYNLLVYMQQPIEHRLPAIARNILPDIHTYVHTWSSVLQLQLASTFHLLLSSSIRVPTANVAVDIALSLLPNDPHHSVLLAWGRLLATALPAVNWAATGSFDQVCATLTTFAHHPAAIYRRLAAKALGPLAVTMSATAADHLLVDTVHTLSHDPDTAVRAALAVSLTPLVDTMPLDISTDPPLWPVFLTLLRDPDAATQAAAVKSFAHAVHAASSCTSAPFSNSSSSSSPSSSPSSPLSPSVLSLSRPGSTCSSGGHVRVGLSASQQKTALSVFMTECSLARMLVANPHSRSAVEVGALLRSLAEAFGPMLHALAHLLSERQRTQAFTSFCACASFPHGAVRRAAAFNFPAVAAVIGPVFERELGDLVEYWSRDEDVRIRASLAAGLHVVAVAVARTPAMRTVLRVALRLLDDHSSVRAKVVGNLAVLLRPVCSRHARPAAAGFVTDVCRVLRRTGGAPWRELADVVGQLRRAAEYLPGAVVHEHVLPMVLEIAKRGSFTVRASCMELGGRLLGMIPTASERAAACKRIVAQWAQADVFKRRVAFVELAHTALQCGRLEDDTEIRKVLETELERLSSDAVCNVRLKLARVLRGTGRGWMTEKTLQNMVAALREDADDEVRAVMRGLDGPEKGRGDGGLAFDGVTDGGEKENSKENKPNSSEMLPLGCNNHDDDSGGRVPVGT